MSALRGVSSRAQLHRADFANLLDRACDRFGWRVRAWVLMRNHFQGSDLSFILPDELDSGPVIVLFGHVMRRMIAILLLAAVGFSVPAVVDGGTLCLAALVKAAVVDNGCCYDCHGQPEQRDRCCLELNQLPKAQVPETAPELPGIAVTDLPRQLAADSWLVVTRLFFPDFRDRMSALDSAQRRRAFLANWRL
jgi:hypothetical protein